jgi:hypothetical protein
MNPRKQTRLKMNHAHCLLLMVLATGSTRSQPPGPPLTRKQWGSPAVKRSHGDGQWIITGQRQTVARLEMTRHEFPGADRHRERTTFADGKTGAVAGNTQSVKINPDRTDIESNPNLNPAAREIHL